MGFVEELMVLEEQLMDQNLFRTNLETESLSRRALPSSLELQEGTFEENSQAAVKPASETSSWPWHRSDHSGHPGSVDWVEMTDSGQPDLLAPWASAFC